jgi:hypothetical protein
MRSSDVDRTLDYFSRHTAVMGRCRLRVWHDEAIVVVTELEQNPGMSVTNAIEDIASLVELVLVKKLDDFLLVEHYPRSTMRGSTYDVVTFTGRQKAGPLVGPAWAPLPDELRRDLREAVDGVAVD